MSYYFEQEKDISDKKVLLQVGYFRFSAWEMDSY